jgi:hypothetical protein
MNPIVAALMGLPVATLLIDKERVLACNEEGKTLLGMDEVCGHKLCDVMDATSVKGLLHSRRMKESPRTKLVLITGAGRRVTVSGSVVRAADQTVLMLWEDASWASAANATPSIRARNAGHGLPSDCELTFLPGGRMSVAYCVDDPALISEVRGWVENGMARPEKPRRHLAIVG